MNPSDFDSQIAHLQQLLDGFAAALSDQQQWDQLATLAQQRETAVEELISVSESLSEQQQITLRDVFTGILAFDNKHLSRLEEIQANFKSDLQQVSAGRKAAKAYTTTSENHE